MVRQRAVDDGAAAVDVAVRCADGARLTARFASDAPLAALFWLVEAEAAVPPDGRFRLAASFPRRVLERPEAADRYDAASAPPPLAAALEAAGLGGTAQLALMVEREGAGGVE